MNAVAWFITRHQGREQFLGATGWVSDIRLALRFATAEDAEAGFRSFRFTNPKLVEHASWQQHEWHDAVLEREVMHQHDYDPFGLGSHDRG